MTKERMPLIGRAMSDDVMQYVRATTGIVATIVGLPLGGAILSEVLSEMIPGQRLPRLEEFCKRLLEQLSVLEVAVESIRIERNAALIEEGALFAIRATDPDKVQRLAVTVARGIAEDERKKLHSSKLISIVAELDAEDVAILDAYASSSFEKFKKIRPQALIIGAADDIVQSNAMYQAAHNRLERLGLIEFKADHEEIQRPNNRGGSTDKVIVAKYTVFGPSGRNQITLLGRLVLDVLGLNVVD
jgi:hypothetical protein